MSTKIKPVLALSFAILFLSPASNLFSEDATSTEQFHSIFNGQDLKGWHGEATMDPRKLAAMSDEQRAEKMSQWQIDAAKHWTAQDGELVNDGHGVYLTTDKSYGDYELLIEYKTVPEADSGIYLKSNPQVQIWNHEDTNLAPGQDKGSGGLWNNSPGAPGKDPSEIADRPFGQWNEFRILQVGSRTSVWLNGKHIVDHAIMENYWDRQTPIVSEGPIQLQTHGGEIRWRNIRVREIQPDEANGILQTANDDGFTSLFDGQDLSGWAGAVENYEAVDGSIRCKPQTGGVLHTSEEYSDFVARVEFKLPPGGNNGLAIRYPGSGDTAYVGMCELQVLDTEHPKYKNLDPRQAHGSAYGMLAAHRGYLRPTGQWNYQEVTVQGSKIKVELNGTIILDGDLAGVNEFLADRPHPGKDRTSGYFGFAGHGDAVEFRNVSIKRLP
ncbi:3-keto-disaccharide hydrolase [Neorhodopirellula lusitana]|uniref:3-keto-disaccharide hydrolase n=1 Tax=Neorhodopirellula lusitana TaxID=445327 RepID=UPI00384B7CC5